MVRAEEASSIDTDKLVADLKDRVRRAQQRGDLSSMLLGAFKQTGLQ